MILSHTIPVDNVALSDFVRVDHSPVTDIYVALSELSITCEPNRILNIKLSFLIDYTHYGVMYTTRRNVDPPGPCWFVSYKGLPEMLNQLLKELPDGTNLYYFGYQKHPVELPNGCPDPEMFGDLHPKLIAVIVKT